MAFFKKLKHLLGNEQHPQDNEQHALSEQTPLLEQELSDDEPNDEHLHQDEFDDYFTAQAEAHLSAISRRIEQWIIDKEWKYDHHLPDDNDDMRTHHFVIGFKDEEFAWTCVFRIHEKNQLITLQGILPDTIEPPYFLPVMAIFTATNYNLSIGNMELDLTTGTARTKIGIDAEFGKLSDYALNCYLQGIASLTEKAHTLITTALQDPNPNQNLIEVLTEQGILETPNETIENGQSYFLVGDTVQ